MYSMCLFKYWAGETHVNVSFELNDLELSACDRNTPDRHWHQVYSGRLWKKRKKQRLTQHQFEFLNTAYCQNKNSPGYTFGTPPKTYTIMKTNCRALQFLQIQVPGVYQYIDTTIYRNISSWGTLSTHWRQISIFNISLVAVSVCVFFRNTHFSHGGYLHWNLKRGQLLQEYDGGNVMLC